MTAIGNRQPTLRIHHRPRVSVPTTRSIVSPRLLSGSVRFWLVSGKVDLFSAQISWVSAGLLLGSAPRDGLFRFQQEADLFRDLTSSRGTRHPGRGALHNRNKHISGCRVSAAHTASRSWLFVNFLLVHGVAASPESCSSRRFSIRRVLSGNPLLLGARQIPSQSPIFKLKQLMITGRKPVESFCD